MLITIWRPRRVLFTISCVISLLGTLLYYQSRGSHTATTIMPVVGKGREAADIELRVKTSEVKTDIISSMHTHYAVNCTAVFAGDEKELTKIKTLFENPPNVPSDVQVAENWLADCGTFKRSRKYPNRAMSEEEAEFPIAYSILVHKDAAQVERLLRSIYQPQNVYCIHVDSKSNEQFKTAIRRIAHCFGNVFISLKSENVQWGGISQVLAGLHCMEDLLKFPVQWKYHFNLCGQDFPLKNNLEIVQQLKAYNGHNFVAGEYVGKGHRFESRYMYKHGPQYQEKKEKKDPPPFNIELYKGSVYIAGTRKFVHFLVHNNISKTFLTWLNDTDKPDEVFFNSLHRLPEAPGGYPYASNLFDGNVKYVKWKDQPTFPDCRGKYVRLVCILRSDDLQYLWRRPEMFVQKFYYDYDPVTMQCIEELLEYKRPGLLQTNTYFPVTNYSWQQYTSKNYIPGL